MHSLDHRPSSSSTLADPDSLSSLLTPKKKYHPTATTIRLEDLGHGVGASLLELLCWRERGGKRTPTALDALKFAHSSLWRALFGRQARDLEQCNTVRSRSLFFFLLFCLSFPPLFLCSEEGEQREEREERAETEESEKEEREARKRERKKKTPKQTKKTLGFSQKKKKKNSTQAEDEYMISDFDLPLLKFVSVPRDFRGLNCAAFAAGAVRGALAAAGFPARVTAHFVPVKGADPRRPRTTILIKFDASVMAREAGRWAG